MGDEIEMTSLVCLACFASNQRNGQSTQAVAVAVAAR